MWWEATQAAVRGGPRPDQAVRDAVADIVQQEAFQRSIGETLGSRLLRMFGRWYAEFWEFMSGTAYGRTIALVALVLLVLLSIARIVVAARTRDASGAIDPGARRRQASADAWRNAQQLAGRGAFTEAAHALFAALIDAFAARGEVRIHASKTAGDYARELIRSRSRSSSSFDAFRRRYDAVIYGGGTCNADQYSVLLSDARTLIGDMDFA